MLGILVYVEYMFNNKEIIVNQIQRRYTGIVDKEKRCTNRVWTYKVIGRKCCDKVMSVFMRTNIFTHYCMF